MGGKASLHEPSRPFTPGDMPRHLFHGNDYSNRPGSSYKMNNILGQAADEFVNYSAQKTQANTNNEPSQRSQEDVLSIMDKALSRGGVPKLGKMPQMRQVMAGHVLPSLDPKQFQKQKLLKKKESLNQGEAESPAASQLSKIKPAAAPNMNDFLDLMGDKNAER